MAAKTTRNDGRWLTRAALVLVVVGGALIAMAVMTPWHTDGAAYLEALNGIRASLYGDLDGSRGMDSFHQASRDFHALQDRYATPKWLYADLGYAAFAWALLLIVVAAVNPTLGSDRRWLVVVPASLAAVALTVVGVAASAFHLVGRQQLPEWSDTLGIPVGWAAGLGVFMLPVVLCLALAPLVFTRRTPAALWSIRGRGWAMAIPVSLIYAGPALFGALGLVTIPEAGGWAVSTGGAILLWLMLNARAVWLGRREDAGIP